MAKVDSLPAVVAGFCRCNSPRVLAATVSFLVAVRLVTISRYGVLWWDLMAIALVVLMVPLVEWVVHRYVLHAKPNAFGPRLDGLGAGHRQHHRDPNCFDWVLLSGTECLIVVLFDVVAAAVVVGLPVFVVGGPVVGSVLTGCVAAVAALFHYEWAHFLFHTAYRPKTRFYRQLKRNHRMHHWRDQSSMLGVTSNLGDRILGTYVAASPSSFQEANIQE